MTATIPTLIAPYAAVLGILGAILTINVILNRVRTKIDEGAGGDARLARAIRAHGNFAEQAPLGLIVIAFAESFGSRAWIVHVLGAALVAGRLTSAYGLNRTLAQSPGRQFGASVNALVLVAASLAILLAIYGIK
jgi:uncharacterized membrane protein YecN with MAPEG domain